MLQVASWALLHLGAMHPGHGSKRVVGVHEMLLWLP